VNKITYHICSIEYHVNRQRKQEIIGFLGCKFIELKESQLISEETT